MHRNRGDEYRNEAGGGANLATVHAIRSNREFWRETTSYADLCCVRVHIGRQRWVLVP